MSPGIRPLARSILSHFPWVEEAKVSLQRGLFRVPGISFEPELELLKLLRATPGALFLDVGGHRGFVTELMLRRCPWARVVAFEPNPLLNGKLARHFRREPRVEVREYGLSTTAGEFTLFIPTYRGYVYYGLASLDRQHAANWLGNGEMHAFDERKLRVLEYRCQVRSLDDCQLAPLFIKLDVQGHELAVLRGGESTLRTHRPILFLEDVGPAGPVMEFLAPLGYRMYRYDRRTSQVVASAGEQDVNALLLTPDRLQCFGRPA